MHRPVQFQTRQNRSTEKGKQAQIPPLNKNLFATDTCWEKEN